MYSAYKPTLDRMYEEGEDTSVYQNLKWGVNNAICTGILFPFRPRCDTDSSVMALARIRK